MQLDPREDDLNELYRLKLSQKMARRTAARRAKSRKRSARKVKTKPEELMKKARRMAIKLIRKYPQR